MTTMTMDAGVATGKIETYRELYQFGRKAITANLAATPDDKLSWKPATGAKSALEVAAHLAASNQYFILSFQGQPPATEFPAIFEWIDKTAAPWTTREQVTNELNRTSDALDQVFNNFTPEMLENEGAKMGLWVCSFHALMHTGQIDYLQTCWGDHEVHYLGNN